MGTSDTAALQKSFGLAVSRYVIWNKLDFHRTKCGVFVLSREHFDTCWGLVNEAFESKQKKFAKYNASRLIARKNNPIRALSAVSSEKTQLAGSSAKEAEKVTNIFERLRVANNLTVEFENEAENVVRSEDSAAEAKNMLWGSEALVFSDSDRRRGVAVLALWDAMMKTQIGSEYMDNSEACRPEIMQILEQFQIRHCKFSYLQLLKNTCKRTGQAKRTNLGQITFDEYRMFVNKVFIWVIPKTLFGCKRNEDLMMEALKTYYTAPYKAPINLKPYVHGFDIWHVKWLEKIKNPKTKCSIMAKIAKWFFEEFFQELFKVIFFEQKSLESEKKIVLNVIKWNCYQNTYIKLGLAYGKIREIDPNDGDNSVPAPSTTMFLYPKPYKVRPIYRSFFSIDEKDLYGLMKTFLQQLYLQRYNFDSVGEFHSVWRTYATRNNEENGNRGVSIVTSDVSDAFGSISQDKLWDIVNEMINVIPHETLALEWYEILPPSERRKRKPQKRYRRWYKSLEVPPCVPKGSLITVSSRRADKMTFTSTNLLRTQIKNFIFGYRKKIYELRRGIAQGHKLSAILSDIYYEHMKMEAFGTFMKSGTLLRYVDDFIYITNDERSATRFLITTSRKIRQYGCKFDDQKTQTNIISPLCKRSEWVTYLGFDVNGSTMEIRPNYRKQEFQYAKWMKNVVNKNPLGTFFRRAKCLSCLKLNPILHDPRINSFDTIRDTTEMSATILAKRTATLLSKIFTDPTSYREAIKRRIRAVVSKFYRSLSKGVTKIGA